MPLSVCSCLKNGSFALLDFGSVGPHSKYSVNMCWINIFSQRDLFIYGIRVLTMHIEICKINICWLDFQCLSNVLLQGRHLWKGSLMVWDYYLQHWSSFLKVHIHYSLFPPKCMDSVKINNKSITGSELLEEAACCLLFLKMRRRLNKWEGELASVVTASGQNWKQDFVLTIVFTKQSSESLGTLSQIPPVCLSWRLYLEMSTAGPPLLWTQARNICFIII